MPLPKLPELDPKKPDKDDILNSKTNMSDLEETDDDIVELTDEDFFDVEESNLQGEINSQPEAYQDKFNHKEQLPADSPPAFLENNQDDLAGAQEQESQAQEQQTDNQKDIQRLSNEIKNSKKRNNPFKGLLKNKNISKLLENKKVKYILISVAAFIGIILLMTILSKFRGNKTQDKSKVQQQQEQQAGQQTRPEEKQTETLQLVKKIKSSTDNESIIIELNKIKEPIELKYLSIYYQEDNNKVNECTLFDLNLDSKTKEVELKCDTQPIVNEFKKVQYLVELERE